MWFGNLVTMEWWDDLWLNEAFATSLSYYICSLGGAHVEEYKHYAMLDMSKYKRWGLSDDILPSNHKIQADCESTDTAESLIDGITYGKGSSMIKQLIFLIGWDVFTNGLKLYFQKYAWGNTTLPDFINAIQEAVTASDLAEKPNLIDWSRDWIQTKGSNRIWHSFKETNGKITEFTLHQSPCKHGDDLLRSQKFNIAIYDTEGTLLETVEKVTLNNSA
jgi:aminopeptidase N